MTHLIPPMPENFNEMFSPSGQNLRKLALHAQLAALAGQVKVINTLAVEHSMGVENLGELDHLFGHAKDLVSSAELIVDRSTKIPKDSTVRSLRALRETAIRLIERANVADKKGLDYAKSRLEHCLNEHADTPPAAVEGIVPNDADGLAVKAVQSCYLAESEQFDTFALQIKAMCHLALEYAYTAAAQSPVFKS